MRYETARELVETILDQLDEGLTPSPKPKPKKFGFEDRVSSTEPKEKFSWQMTSAEKEKYFGNKGSKPAAFARKLKEAILDTLDEATITEGAVKGLLNDMGYFFTDEGNWVHEKTGKALSDAHATKIAAERHARNRKKKEASTTRDPYRKQKIKRAKYLRQNPMPVPASKHGPTDAKPVNPGREGARHGPTI